MGLFNDFLIPLKSYYPAVRTLTLGGNLQINDV